MTRKINKAGADLIKSFEGLHDGDPRTPALEPKLCPAGIWTVGWGHALTSPTTGKHIKGESGRAEAMAEWRRRWPAGMTRADADVLFSQDAARFEQGVERLCPVPLTDNQFAALVSLTYNIGLGAEGGSVDFADSTLRRKLLAGDYAGAAAEFPKWNRSGGQVMAGLTRRREAERALFLKG